MGGDDVEKSTSSYGWVGHRDSEPLELRVHQFSGDE